jgi:DNA-binding beta-propeller fold protein YncE
MYGKPARCRRRRNGAPKRGDGMRSDFGSVQETLTALVEVGQRPGHILVTPDQQYALVLNQQSGDLAVIRLYSLGAAQSERVRRWKSAPLFTLIPVGERPVSAAVVSWT